MLLDPDTQKLARFSRLNALTRASMRWPDHGSDTDLMALRSMVEYEGPRSTLREPAPPGAVCDRSALALDGSANRFGRPLGPTSVNLVSNDPFTVAGPLRMKLVDR